MRILHVSPYFKPAWETGGTARVAYEQAKALDQKGHDVTVFTTDIGKDRLDVPTGRTTSVDGIETVYFRNVSNYVAYNFNILNSPRSVIELLRRVREFDIIHIHEHRHLLAVSASNAARFYGIPYVVQAHGSLPYNIGKTHSKRLFDALTSVVKDANQVVAVSELEFNQYREYGIDSEDITIIPNGVVPNADSATDEPQSVFQKHNISEREYILYLGRISKRKGLVNLIRAFEKVSETHSDIALVIAGANSGYRKRLEKRAAESGVTEKIYLTGYVENKESLFESAEVLVYPTQGEIFGLVPFEAVTCGTPVIVSERSGGAGHVSTGGFGILVDDSDPNELANAVKTLLSKPETAEKMASRGENYVEETLAWSEIIPDIELLYQDLIGQDG